jgi:hypothetical protein
LGFMKANVNCIVGGTKYDSSYNAYHTKSEETKGPGGRKSNEGLACMVFETPDVKPASVTDRTSFPCMTYINVRRAMATALSADIE